MKWASLDNKIQNDVSAYRPDVDADEIWAAIEPGVDAINNRKKRRGALWFWWFGALAITTATVYFLFAKPHQLPPANKGIAHSTNKIEANTVESGLNGNAKRNNNHEQEMGFTSANCIKNGNSISIKATKDNEEFPLVKNEKKPAINVFTNDNFDLKNNKTSLPAKQVAMPANTVHVPMDLAQELVAKFEPTTAPATLPISSIGLLETNYSPPSNKAIEARPALAAPTSLRRRFNLSASLQGSIGFVGRELTAKAPTGIALRDLRERTEKMLESYQIGLGFTIGHRSGLGLSSGLNYTQVNERFEYKATVIAVDTIYDIKYLVVTLNNDTIPIYGDVPLSIKTTYQKKYYNKLRMIDIPILAGYDIKLRNSAIGFQAGVFVNMQLKTQGQILQSNNETVKLEEADIFKSKIGLSYYFGASAGYRFNENMEAYVAPFVRHFPKSFTLGNYPLQQRYSLFGVNMGVRYRF